MIVRYFTITRNRGSEGNQITTTIKALCLIKNCPIPYAPKGRDEGGNYGEKDFTFYGGKKYVGA